MSVSEPAVSRASLVLMCKLSLDSFSKEKASAIEIARGMPSGTDTIRIARQIWKFLIQDSRYSKENSFAELGPAFLDPICHFFHNLKCLEC